MLAHVRYVTEGEAGDPIAFLTGVLGRVETWIAFGVEIGRAHV